MKKVNFYLIILCLLSNFINAQPWMQQITTENPSFYEIRAAFNEYWKNRPYEKDTNNLRDGNIIGNLAC